MLRDPKLRFREKKHHFHVESNEINDKANYWNRIITRVLHSKVV
jgi:hypothetical protein